MTIETLQLRTKSSFFFILTFGWSLVFWILTVALGGIDRFPGSILQYVGGAGPLVAALIITHFFEDSTVRKDFWSRTFDPRRIPWRWLVVSLLFHPAILFIAIVIDSILGGNLPGPGNIFHLSRGRWFFSHPGTDTKVEILALNTYTSNPYGNTIGTST